MSVVAFIAERVFGDRPGRAEARGIAHIVIGGAHQVTGVALLDQLGHSARGQKRNIVRMRLECEQHLSLVRPAFGRALQDGSACRGLLLGAGPLSHGRARHHAA